MNENKLDTEFVYQDPFQKSNVLKSLIRAWKVIAELLGAKKPLTDIAYTNQEVASVFSAVSGNGDGYVDDQTWKDLELWKYSASLKSGVSILGQQGIHLRLRQGTGDTNAIAALIDDVDLSGTLKKTLEPMRRLEFDISTLLFCDKKIEAPKWTKILAPFQAILLIAMLAPFISLTMFIPLAGLICLTFLIQASWLSHIERYDEKLAGLRTILDVGSELSKLANVHTSPTLNSFVNEVDEIRKVKRQITRSIFETGSQMTKLYADWFFLNNIRHHFKAIKVIRQNQPLLQRWYLLIANLEADLAMAKHIELQSHFCWASPQSGNQLALKDVVNPLLINASPITFSTGKKSIFLSGQNGVGKSTFLRTLGLNLLVGRAFGFCYATSATIPTSQIYTSIQIEDSMEDGESLYVAELLRAKKLLDSSKGKHAGIVLIDEIFRGTNHLESVSVAAAFIHALAQNALVIVSSHNLVLAPLLSAQLLPMQITSELNKVTIKKGLLEKPNGISLLNKIGFEESMSQNATNISLWLSEYLTHPSNCPDFLKGEGVE